MLSFDVSVALCGAIGLSQERLLDMRHRLCNALIHCLLVSAAMHVRPKWRFIGIVDSRKMRQLPCARLFVQPLWITALAHFQRRINIDLGKTPDMAAQRAPANVMRWVAAEEAREKQGKPGRNDPCLCGSGKKSKNCCL